tara:strand:+ start:43 stop:369 length:327 start_codon:yes stop_codon:yes gene_type:complete
MTYEVIKSILSDINKQSDKAWINSSWHNDACGSVMYDLDNDTETFVQLFAFESEEERDGEGFDELYAIIFSINGDRQWDVCFTSNNKQEAINKACEMANQLYAEYVPD